MEQKQHSAKFLRQRKFMMVLPLLVLPFIIIFFVALGGGKGKDSSLNTDKKPTGLNTKLPDAHFKKGKEKDKLGLYQEAQNDSAKFLEQIKNDPYYKPEPHELKEGDANKTGELQTILERAASKYNQGGPSKLKTSPGKEGVDPVEEKVMAKLELLKNELSKKNIASTEPPATVIPRSIGPDVQKLENMMRAINSKNDSDPELKELSGMLDKIMLIQHPEKIRDSTRAIEARNKPEPFAVSPDPHQKNISCIDNPDSVFEESQNGFYGFGDADGPETDRGNAIEAVVEQTQTIVPGAVVKLRLLQDVFIKNIRIPKDELVYGSSALTGERLKITVSSIRKSASIMPVSLNIFDMDGLEGIYVPGSVTSDAGKQSADQATSGIGIASLGPSLAAQAASAGLQAAKTLLSKKIKLVRVTLKAGYHVLLKDNSQK